jgi:hypothetical protein
VSSSLNYQPQHSLLISYYKAGPGFILLTEAMRQKYSLRPGITQSRDSEHVSVSVFHQLRCLKIIRESYFELLLVTANHTRLQDIPPAACESDEAY